MTPTIHIGTSGWTYPHWTGVFYPENWPKSKWLEFYARNFSTVELNATFYRLPQEKTIAGWRERTPDSFVWAVKANRFITHIRKLREVRESLEKFFTSVEQLREKLGPILFQLPPSLAYDHDVFTHFCACLKPDRLYTLEVRHASWLEDKALATMSDSGIAFCVSDTAGRYPYGEALTADFVYVRLHGGKQLYVSDYPEEELQLWAQKIRNWGRKAYVYFDNDFAGNAPRNALRLREILGSDGSEGV